MRDRDDRQGLVRSAAAGRGANEAGMSFRFRVIELANCRFDQGFGIVGRRPPIGLVFWVQSPRSWTRRQQVRVLRGRERLTLPPRGAALRPTDGSPEMAFSDPYVKAIRNRAARLANDWGDLTRIQGAFALNLNRSRPCPVGGRWNG